MHISIEATSLLRLLIFTGPTASSVLNEQSGPRRCFGARSRRPDGTAELKAELERLKRINATAPLAFDLYLGRRSPEAVLKAGMETLRTQCETNFHVGQWRLLRNNRDEARRLLQAASANNARASIRPVRGRLQS